MPTKTGLKLGTTWQEINGNEAEWTSESNILNSDPESTASLTFNSDPEDTPTTKLKVRGFNFALPRGAKVGGVELAFLLNANQFDYTVRSQLLVADAAAGTPKSFATETFGQVLFTLGGATDLWGLSEITWEQVNDPLFGIFLNHIAGEGMSNGWYKLAYAQMSVWYEESNASSLGIGQSPLP